jgi:hypothetical protein
MSEWLTTGEMIDRLKVGEVAVNQDGWKVTFGRKGDLLYFHESQEPDEENKFTMSLMFLKKDRWRILPRYVSFEEAYEAGKQGKVINFHYEDGVVHKIEHFDDSLDENGLSCYCLRELIEGDWSIEN